MYKFVALVLVVSSLTVTMTVADEPPASAPTVKSFVHPGLLHSRAEIDFIKQKIAGGEQPWISAWEQFQSSRSRSRSSGSSGPSSLDYRPRPFADVVRGVRNDRNIGSSDMSNDSMAAYTHALQWCLTGKHAHATKTIEILNAWSRTLKSVSGHDAKLPIGVEAIPGCMACDILS